VRTHILPLPIIGAMIIRIRYYYGYIILQGGAPKKQVFWEVNFIKKILLILSKISMQDRRR